MSKFRTPKGRNYQRPQSAQNRPMTPIEINNLEETPRNTASRSSGTRSTSALLGIDFLHSEILAIFYSSQKIIHVHRWTVMIFRMQPVKQLMQLVKNTMLHLWN